MRSPLACGPADGSRNKLERRANIMRFMEEWIGEHKTDEVECLVADLSGIPRGKILPAAKYLKIVRENGLRLPESVFIQTVTGEYSENADYIKRIASTGHNGDVNTLGMIAARAAYSDEGEAWLGQLLTYIAGNHEFVESFVRENIPEIRYKKPQGTYLAFLDVNGVIERIGAAKQAAASSPKVTPEAIVSEFFVKEAKVQIIPGSNYGAGGAGHMRMNVATSRRTIELALGNMAKALKRV